MTSIEDDDELLEQLEQLEGLEVEPVAHDLEACALEASGALADAVGAALAERLGDPWWSSPPARAAIAERLPLDHRTAGQLAGDLVDGARNPRGLVVSAGTSWPPARTVPPAPGRPSCGSCGGSGWILEAAGDARACPCRSGAVVA